MYRLASKINLNNIIYNNDKNEIGGPKDGRWVRVAASKYNNNTRRFFKFICACTVHM